MYTVHCTCNCTCSLPTIHVTLYTAYIFKFYKDINVLLASPLLPRAPRLGDGQTVRLGPTSITLHCRCCPHFLCYHTEGCLLHFMHLASFKSLVGPCFELWISLLETFFGDKVCCAKCFFTSSLLFYSKLHRLKRNISCIFLSILYPWLLFLLGAHLCEYCMPYIHTTCCTFMASHCKHPKLACVPLKTYMAK